jgi:hypothetical protein
MKLILILALALGVMDLEAKGQHTKPGMPTPVLEPPQCKIGDMATFHGVLYLCESHDWYVIVPMMAVPGPAERDQELQEEWEDCFDADPVTRSSLMCLRM